MGIPGIYNEIGAVPRVSLAKLTAESFRNNDRPLRIAVDFAIWEFQNRAATGGTNAPIRTLFYRLTRMLGTPVQPIFVFDGPNKPAFKRGKNSARGSNATISQAQAKHLIRLFGFPVHDAPGEGEAECALLQRQGIVDKVMTEDVDAIMFGSTSTIRNWAADGKSQKTPTHVDVYDVKNGSINGLGREGLVLVAMMSGGDYLPDGIRNCGVATAAQAARAGFGKDLCRLKRSDTEGLKAWRASLIHELSTNESKHFSQRNVKMASNISDDFPNMEVLQFYTRPFVSNVDSLGSLREKVRQQPQLRLDDLREFTRQTFGWDHRIGAEKFIKVIGDALLARKMLYQPEEAAAAIQKISTRREHFNVDGEPELRMSYIPEQIVPIDISGESTEPVSAPSRDGLALNDDDDEPEVETSTTTSSQVKQFDITQPVLSWVLEEFAQRMVPDLVTNWKDAKRSKQLRSPRKKKGSGTQPGMPRGAIDKFFSVTKKASASATVKMIESTSLNHDEPRKTLRQTAAGIESPPIFNIPSSPPSSRSREHSKDPKPSRPNDGDDARSLHRTPRSRSEKVPPQEPILITSSPLAASPSPSPRRSRPQSSAAGSSQVSGAVRPGFAAIGSSQGLSSKSKPAPKQRTTTTKTVNAKKKVQVSTKDGTKFKQTSMELFAKKTQPASSQPLVSSQVSQRPSKVDKLFDPFDDSSDDDLPPLSSMTFMAQSTAPIPTKAQEILKLSTTGRDTARRRRSSDPFASDDEFHSLPSTSPVVTKSPKSPGKRLKSPSDSEREAKDPTTPTKASKSKKKLLVPRISAVGYYKEIEVDASERESMIREIEKVQGKGRVARVSDISLIDLTQDD